MNIDPSTTKYMVKAKLTADGIVEKPDVVGAIFGQTEGLLGEELDLRDLQKSGRIGRIDKASEQVWRNGVMIGYHIQPLDDEQLARIEAMVNAEIRANAEAEVHHMGMQEALDFGAIALFGEKYGEHVRVLRMGEFSTELCGGTHVSRTGDIGLFKIVAEGGVAAGVRRIEAVTGQGALDLVADEERRLDEVASLVGGSAAEVVDKLRQLLDRQKRLERELESFKAKAAAGAASDLASTATDIRGVKVVAARLEGMDPKALRESVDSLKEKLGDAVIVLAAVAQGKAALVAGVNGSALGKVKAGELLGHVAAQIGGKAGGRPDMAQGGGEDSPALPAALEGVASWVSDRLG